jgi:hypothetical protein
VVRSVAAIKASTCGTNWARTVVFNDGLNDVFYVKTGVATTDGRLIYHQLHLHRMVLITA